MIAVWKAPNTRKWYVVDGSSKVVAGPFNTRREAALQPDPEVQAAGAAADDMSEDRRRRSVPGPICNEIRRRNGGWLVWS